MAEDATDRTEAPSPRRREEARRQGQVALSPEVAPALVLLSASIVASWGLPLLVERSMVVFRAWLANLGPMAAHDDSAAPMLSRAALQLGGLLTPFFLVMGFVGTGAIVAQIGFMMTPDLVMPKLSRISPTTGLQRMFSSQGVANLLKSVAKIAVLGTIAWQVLDAQLGEVISTPGMGLDALMSLTGGMLDDLVWWLVMALIVIGALDVVWQRYHFEQSLKMSRHDVREEQKQSEGDPQVKARFRRAARELGKRRMLSEVARADVVLANPVHVAVALRYRATEGGAPRVVAKGAGELAQRIKEAARQAGVPIVERRALARALYRTVEIGQEVPPALYRAIAEILAYIYSLRGRRAEAP